MDEDVFLFFCIFLNDTLQSYDKCIIPVLFPVYNALLSVSLIVLSVYLTFSERFISCKFIIISYVSI